MFQDAEIQRHGVELRSGFSQSGLAVYGAHSFLTFPKCQTEAIRNALRMLAEVTQAHITLIFRLTCTTKGYYFIVVVYGVRIISL